MENYPLLYTKSKTDTIYLKDTFKYILKTYFYTKVKRTHSRILPYRPSIPCLYEFAKFFDYLIKDYTTMQNIKIIKMIDAYSHEQEGVGVAVVYSSQKIQNR